MTPSDRLENALKETGLPYAEDFYFGKNDKYIVWKETGATDTDFADNQPVEETTSFVVQYVCKDRENDDTREIRKQLEVILRRHGFYVTNKERITNKEKVNDPREDYIKAILYVSLVG